MNIDTLAVILILSLVAAILARMANGFTLAGFLASFLLACAAGIGGWLLERQLRLPPLYELRLPGGDTPVALVWPGLAALLAAFAGGLVWRPSRPRRRTRR